MTQQPSSLRICVSVSCATYKTREYPFGELCTPERQLRECLAARPFPFRSLVEFGGKLKMNSNCVFHSMNSFCKNLSRITDCLFGKLDHLFRSNSGLHLSRAQLQTQLEGDDICGNKTAPSKDHVHTTDSTTETHSISQISSLCLCLTKLSVHPRLKGHPPSPLPSHRPLSPQSL